MKEILFKMDDELLHSTIKDTAIQLWNSEEYTGDCESEDCVVNETFESCDGSTYQILLESAIDDFKEFFNKKNKTNYWKMKSDSIGWSKVSGFRYFEAEAAEEFIEEVRPEFNHSIEITHYKNGFEINISSHDSPLGDLFTLTPIERSTYERNY